MQSNFMHGLFDLEKTMYKGKFPMSKTNVLYNLRYLNFLTSARAFKY